MNVQNMAKGMNDVVGVIYVCFDKNMERRLFHMRDTAERHTTGDIDEYVPAKAYADLQQQLAAAREALRTIRDSTYRNALQLRAIADATLQRDRQL